MKLMKPVIDFTSVIPQLKCWSRELAIRRHSRLAGLGYSDDLRSH